MNEKNNNDKITGFIKKNPNSESRKNTNSNYNRIATRFAIYPLLAIIAVVGAIMGGWFMLASVASCLTAITFAQVSSRQYNVIEEIDGNNSKQFQKDIDKIKSKIEKANAKISLLKHEKEIEALKMENIELSKEMAIASNGWKGISESQKQRASELPDLIAKLEDKANSKETIAEIQKIKNGVNFYIQRKGFMLVNNKITEEKFNANKSTEKLQTSNSQETQSKTKDNELIK